MKSPFVAVARYGAIGRPPPSARWSCHPWWSGRSARPFANASRPAGTVIANSNVALSRGLSLTGYQPGEPCGSLTTKAPSSVGTQPSIDLSGSLIAFGLPAYSTSTVNGVPASRLVAGLIWTSWAPGRANWAGAPLTVKLRDRVEVAEVEVEAAQVLGRGGLDDRRAAEEVGGLVVVERERVMRDVVAPVPGLREEGIAAAVGAGDVLLAHGGRDDDEKSAGCDRQRPAKHD